MTAQLHITHRTDYLSGRRAGRSDALAGDYRPHAGDSDSERAYRLGYTDGYAEANPCENATCQHLAHNPNA